MSDFSSWSILFITLPEQFLILGVCLSIAGYKDVFNFRITGNMIRFFLAVIVMVASSVTLAVLIDNANTTKLLIQELIYLIIVFVLFRHNILKCLGGLLVSSILIIVGEAITLSIVLGILQISVNEIYSFNTWQLVLLSLPTRFLQIGCLYGICRLKKISIEIKQLKRNEIISVLFCILIIVMNMYQIEYLFKLELRNLARLVIMFSNAIFTTAFSIYSVYRTTNIQSKLLIESNIHSFDLHRVKQLIEEGRSDYAIELIDLTLKARNYYK